MLARAKINLTLEVFGVRPDGYHDIRSLMVPVSFADEVSVLPAASGIRVRMDAPESELGHLPRREEDNLAYRAAMAVARHCGRGGAEISISKRIPSGAGLGGGSADAAAVVRALVGMWMPGLPEEEMFAICAEVGSDVPALAAGNAVEAEGRGERFRKVRGIPALHLVLAFPEARSSTAEVYARFRAGASGRTGNATAEVCAALREGDLAAAAAALRNDLAEAAESLCPEIGRVRKIVEEAGAIGASMTGSGSCVFGLARSATHAERLAEKISGAGISARAVESMSGDVMAA